MTWISRVQAQESQLSISRCPISSLLASNLITSLQCEDMRDCRTEGCGVLWRKSGRRHALWVWGGKVRSRDIIKIDKHQHASSQSCRQPPTPSSPAWPGPRSEPYCLLGGEWQGLGLLLVATNRCYCPRCSDWLTKHDSAYHYNMTQAYCLQLLHLFFLQLEHFFIIKKTPALLNYNGQVLGGAPSWDLRFWLLR